MSLGEWAQSNEHIFSGGRTQSGKSVVANYIAHSIPERVSIYWNDDKERFVRGRRAHGLTEVGEHIENGARAIDYRPQSWEGDALEAEFGRLVEFLFRLNDPHEYDIPFTLVVDEAQEVASADSPLYRAAKRGAKRGIKCIIISQTFQAVPKDLVRQTEFKLWVGPPDEAFDREYFENKGLPFEPLLELGEHQAAVLDGSDVIERFKAPRKYSRPA